MKHIEIAAVYNKINYGTVLQAYASQKVLDNLGYSNSIIDTRGLNKVFSMKKKKYFIRHIFEKDMLSSKIGFVIKKIVVKINFHNMKANERTRKNKFDQFIDEYFRLSPGFTNITDLARYTEKNAYAVMAASDQIWLPQHIDSGYFSLQWVPKNVKRFSLASSFGKSIIPYDMTERYISFINKLDSISVREKDGQRIVEDLTSKNAVLLCDPTMMLSMEDWNEILPEERPYGDKYILCYFLGTNKMHRKYAETLREKTGFKIVSLIHMDEYFAYDEKYADEMPFSVGPKEFLQYIKYAEFVLTDSFHGTVFSIIFEKKFVVFNRFSNTNSMSTNGRITTLLEKIGLQNRLVDSINISTAFQNVDYKNIAEIVNNERKKAIRFIIESVGSPQRSANVVEILKNECTACTACLSICPVHCISMKADEEGFLYPAIDERKCINCGLCIKVCPSKRNDRKNIFEQKAYIVQNVDNDIRSKSTSGGAFSAIAGKIIRDGGTVYGASYTGKKLHVAHYGANTLHEITSFMGSKYVQSDLKNSFTEIKHLLEAGKKVCFSGTPCQIEGLLSFLGHKNDNLLLVDIVCRGVPSPRVWEEYVCFQENKYDSNILSASFRDKGAYGYTYSQLSITNQKAKLFLGGVDNNAYLRSFFENINVRPSCYCCKYRSRYRKSDITLWDCLDITDFTDVLDKKGATRVLIHSAAGQKIFNEISDCYRGVSISADSAVENVTEMKTSRLVNSKREQFFASVAESGVSEELLGIFFKDNCKKRIEHFARVLGVKTGLYTAMKKIFNMRKL